MTTAPGRKLSGVLVSGVVAGDTQVVGAALRALGVRGLGKRRCAQRTRESRTRGSGWHAGTRHPRQPPRSWLTSTAPWPRRRVNTYVTRWRSEGSLRAGSGCGPIPGTAFSPRSGAARSTSGSPSCTCTETHDLPCAALIREHCVEPEAGLMLWERYNRAALVSCDQWPSLVLSHQATVADPDKSAQTLASFLDQLGAFENHDLASASKAIDARARHTSGLLRPGVVLAPAHQVLDEILSDLDGHVMDRSHPATRTQRRPSPT